MSRTVIIYLWTGPPIGGFSLSTSWAEHPVTSVQATAASSAWTITSLSVYQPYLMGEKSLRMNSSGYLVILCKYIAIWYCYIIQKMTCAGGCDLPFGTNLSEWLNIQKRDKPSSGPSFRNSWPSPLPHLPHRTCTCM